MAIGECDDGILVKSKGSSEIMLPPWIKVLPQPDLPVIDSGEIKFALFDETAFKTAIRHNWRSAILEIVAILFRTTHEKRFEYDCADYNWCLWHLLAEAESKNRFQSLDFDNLQHTTRINLEFASSDDFSGLAKGATAYTRQQTANAFEVHWADNSWNPISAGFVLA